MAPAPAWQPGRRGHRVASLARLALLGTALGAMASACYDFTFVDPSPGAEGGTPREAGPDGCQADVAYCGGQGLPGAADTLYRCAIDGGSELIKKCASGCLADAGDARCKPPTAPCQVGGNYCGGDKLDGDPRILYRCASGGTAAVLERCAKGCVVMPAGSDDECAR